MTDVDVERFPSPPADAPWWRGICRSEHGERDFVMRAPDEEWVRAFLADAGYELVEVAVDTEYKPAESTIGFFRSVPRAREMVGAI